MMHIRAEVVDDPIQRCKKAHFEFPTALCCNPIQLNSFFSFSLFSFIAIVVIMVFGQISTTVVDDAYQVGYLAMIEHSTIRDTVI